jgi:hypothetical protein
MAMKNFGKDGFRKIYYETLNEKIQDGMASYSKERMFIQSAFRRGYDSKEVSKENEVFFTLGKYAYEKSKNWYRVYNLQKICI